MIRRAAAALGLAGLGGLAAWAAADPGFEGVNASALLEQARSEARSTAGLQPRPAAQNAPARAPAVKEWTVMVFMNGRNDLARNAVRDINEMEQVGSTPDVNVVVEAGIRQRTGLAYPPPRRMLILKDADGAGISSPVVQESVADMGDWRRLAEFIRWAKENYPAHRTMLIVWNHGSGWRSMAASPPARGGPDPGRGGVVYAGISEDISTGHSISTVELGKALAQGGGVDIYASDACQMQMAEVAYELRGWAEVIVCSEESAPVDGQSYGAFLGLLAGGPRASVPDAARLYVAAFAESHVPHEGATQSAVRSAALPGLLSLLDDWTDALRSSDEREAVAFARSGAKHFSDYDYKDLYHFAQLATGRAKSEAARQSGRRLLDYLRRDVVVENAVVTEANQNAFGLSVYVPHYDFYVQEYDDLAWARDGKWDEFLHWMTRP